MKNCYVLLMLCFLTAACVEQTESTREAKKDFTSLLRTSLEKAFNQTDMLKEVTLNDSTSQHKVTVGEDTFQSNFEGLSFYPDNFEKSQLGDTTLWLDIDDNYSTKIRFIERDGYLQYFDFKETQSSGFSSLVRNILYAPQVGVKVDVYEDLIGVSPRIYLVNYLVTN